MYLPLLLLVVLGSQYFGTSQLRSHHTITPFNDFKPVILCVIIFKSHLKRQDVKIKSTPPIRNLKILHFFSTSCSCFQRF